MQDVFCPSVKWCRNWVLTKTPYFILSVAFFLVIVKLHSYGVFFFISNQLSVLFILWCNSSAHPWAVYITIPPDPFPFSFILPFLLSRRPNPSAPFPLWLHCWNWALFFRSTSLSLLSADMSKTSCWIPICGRLILPPLRHGGDCLFGWSLLALWTLKDLKGGLSWDTELGLWWCSWGSKEILCLLKCTKCHKEMELAPGKYTISHPAIYNAGKLLWISSYLFSLSYQHANVLISTQHEYTLDGNIINFICICSKTFSMYINE